MKENKRYYDPIIWSILLINIILIITGLLNQWTLHVSVALIFLEHILFSIFFVLRTALYNMEFGVEGTVFQKILKNAATITFVCSGLLYLEYLLLLNTNENHTILAELDDKGERYLKYVAYGIVASALFQILYEQFYKKNADKQPQAPPMHKHLYSMIISEIVLIVCGFVLLVIGQLQLPGFIILVFIKMMLAVYYRYRHLKL